MKAWDRTVDRLRVCLQAQDAGRPLVLVTSAPVFGFSFVETLQEFVSKLFGDYKFDLESWGANEEHFADFLSVMTGRNVVVLSGDVHYGYTSTVRFVTFDSDTARRGARRPTPTGTLMRAPAGAAPTYRPTAESRFVQLNSSALKNYASTLTWLASKLSFNDPATILTDDGDELYGRYENGVFVTLEQSDDGTGLEQQIRLPADVRPVSMFRQRVNDAYNSAYVEEHNLGIVSIRGTTVRHRFETPNGKVSERTWDFTNPRYWE